MDACFVQQVSISLWAELRSRVDLSTDTAGSEHGIPEGKKPLLCVDTLNWLLLEEISSDQGTCGF